MSKFTELANPETGLLTGLTTIPRLHIAPHALCHPIAVDILMPGKWHIEIVLFTMSPEISTLIIMPMAMISTAFQVRKGAVTRENCALQAGQSIAIRDLMQGNKHLDTPLIVTQKRQLCDCTYICPACVAKGTHMSDIVNAVQSFHVGKAYILAHMMVGCLRPNFCITFRHTRKRSRRSREMQSILDSLKVATSDAKVGVPAAMK